MTSKKSCSIILIVFMLVMACLLAGCAQEQAEKDLVVAVKSDIGSIEPDQMKQATFLVYQGLVTLEPNLNLAPCLAVSWQASAGGTEWTFNLRKGVKFHDGSEFKANDVKVSFERIMHEKGTSYWQENLVKIECPDEYTVKFALTKPNYLFPNLLTHYDSAIISDTALDAEGKIVKPIGTGPFVFEDWQKDNKIVLKANKDYWDGAPRLKGVVLRVIPDPDVAVSALEAGEIDMTLLFQSVTHAPRVKQNPDLKLMSTVGDVNNMLAMNITREPFNDLKVRQAINHAIEKKQTIKTILGDAAEPQDYMFCSIWDKYLNKSAPCYEYSPEKAKELLAEAGWKDVDGDGILEKNGKKLEFDIEYRMNAADHAKLGEVIQSQLAKVGVKVNLLPVETGALAKKTREQNYDTYLTGQWANIYHEPGPVYEYYFKRKGIFEIWSSEETDSLIADLKTTSDQDDRIKIHHLIQQNVMENAPVVYLYNEKYVMAMKKEIEGFEVCAEFWHMFCTLDKTYIKN